MSAHDSPALFESSLIESASSLGRPGHVGGICVEPQTATGASQHPAVALDRAAQRGARGGGGGRPRGEADLLLRRVRGRRLEDHRRRHVLAQRIRRLLRHLLSRRARGGGRRPLGRIRRDGRGVHTQQRLSRRRRLPVHGRRGDVEAHRPRRHAAHRACQGRPARPRPALRRRAGPRIRPQRAAGGLPLQGRRPHLGARALQEREGRCAIDLSIDPQQSSRILYAAIWQALRTPWSFVGAGPESGLWRSTDGGDTWTDLTERPGDAGRDQGPYRRSRRRRPGRGACGP